MLIARALAERLTEVGQDPDQILETLLYEIPDEALEVFHNMADPVEVKISHRVEDLMEQVAEAFGMNTMGLTVLMSKVLDKTLQVAARLSEHEAS